MRARSLAFFALISLPILGAACAEAGELGLDDDGTTVLPTTDAGDSGTTSRGDGGSATPPKGSSSGASGGSSGASGSSSSGDAGGGSSSGGSSSSSGGSSSGGTGQPDVCTGSVSCGSSTNIGQIFGDYPSSVTHSAKQSKWVTFKVEDDPLTPFTSHSYGLKFTPAAGTQYEVRLASCDFTGSAACDPCGANSRLIAPNSYSNFTEYWDDIPASGDHRQIAVFVKQIDGTCPTTATWRLDVTGDVP